jgi:GT2 family glycosyltransferase
VTEFFLPRSGRSDRRRVLQRVVYDPPPGAEDLYLRRLAAEGGGAAFRNDTYVNLFHQSRWRRLTDLTDFALEVNGAAGGLIRLFSAAGRAEEPPILRAEARLDAHTPSATFPLAPEADFFFFEWRPDDGLSPPPAAEYTAERLSDSAANPRIALVITTFAREADVRRLVATYIQARRDLAEIRELTVLYVVNNQINDAEKLADLRTEGVTLINNPRNTGGAGGFSRGAKEALAAGWATHTLFMDDDVVIHPEAWFRTLTLARTLKRRYAGQVICGGMFTRENPTYCHTLAEAQDRRARHQNLAGDRDLADPAAVRRLLGQIDSDGGFPAAEAIPPEAGSRPYSAWWYCCIPVNNFKTFGFPLPVFFRGDDIEFGLRISRKALPLNGIFIWHPDFTGQKKQKNLLRAYLAGRNYFLYATLHFPAWRWLVFCQFMRIFNRALAANDYETAAVILAAFSDYADFHRRQGDGPEILARIKRARAAFPNAVKPAGEVGEPVSSSESRRGGGLKSLVLVILTLGGGLLPWFVFRRTLVQVGLFQVNGQFPARYVTQHHDPSILIFQRLPALGLSLKMLSKAAVFLISGNRVRKRLKAFLASPFIQKGEWI